MNSPAGYKLVPIEPTPEMVAAARNVGIVYPGRGYQNHHQPLKKHEAMEVWSAMLATAPDVGVLVPSGPLQQAAAGMQALDAGHDPLCMAVLRGKACTCGVNASGEGQPK